VTGLTAADLIGRAQLPTADAELCLDPSLIMQWRDRHAEWERAGDKAESMGKRSPKAELADQLRALDEQLKAATVKVKVRAISASAWGILRAQHPGETPGTINVDSFCPAALAACAIEPTFTVEEANGLMDHLSDGQRDLLMGPIFVTNERQLSVPFDERVSARTPGSGA
jgi:hypothetical protein